MKIFFVVFATVLAAAFRMQAESIAGPFTNPANGHDYFLLSAGSWTASEAEAEDLGGTLAIIRSAADQEWVFSKFGAYGGTNRNLWIGLHREFQGGPFVWATGARVEYSNWEAGQPDNAGGSESYAHMFGKVGNRSPGVWNDLADINFADGAPICGVVEVPGTANEKALTEKEKSLVGTWYQNGRADRMCWIAGTENTLFGIAYHQSSNSRLVYTRKGFLFAPHWHCSGEILKDKILWSDGSWWSRKPIQYETGEASDGIPAAGSLGD